MNKFKFMFCNDNSENSKSFERRITVTKIDRNETPYPWDFLKTVYVPLSDVPTEDVIDMEEIHIVTKNNNYPFYFATSKQLAEEAGVKPNEVRNHWGEEKELFTRFIEELYNFYYLTEEHRGSDGKYSVEDTYYCYGVEHLFEILEEYLEENEVPDNASNIVGVVVNDGDGGNYGIIYESLFNDYLKSKSKEEDIEEDNYEDDDTNEEYEESDDESDDYIVEKKATAFDDIVDVFSKYHDFSSIRECTEVLLDIQNIIDNVEEY